MDEIRVPYSHIGTIMLLRRVSHHIYYETLEREYGSAIELFSDMQAHATVERLLRELDN